jgi:hypothetical protein
MRIVNDEFKWMWTKSIVAYFNVGILFQHFPEEAEEYTSP